ncbi:MULTISPECIES: hypothetical protein [unclassified Microcoleus]|uniref:hypothetical protein n=1 Tax=unclassified Microcoleus TaxID=2642155 RepID=UPI002FCFB9FD
MKARTPTAYRSRGFQVRSNFAIGFSGSAIALLDRMGDRAFLDFLNQPEISGCNRIGTHSNHHT